MSEIIYDYELGWKAETTLGTNSNGAYTALIAADTCYKFGDINKLVSIRPEMTKTPFFKMNQRYRQDLSIGKFIVTTTIPFGLTSGIPFYWALGKSTDGTDGSVKTHTISGIDPTENLPSFVIHYEGKDKNDTSNYYTDVYGSRVNNFNLNANIYRNDVQCIMDIISQDMEHDGNSVALTNSPNYKDTSTNSVFLFNKGTYTYDEGGGGDEDLDQIYAFNMSITNNIEPIWVDQVSDKIRAKYLRPFNRIITWSYGILLKDGMLIDEVRSSTEKDLEINFERTDSDDNIIITLSDVIVKSAPIQVPELGEKNAFVVGGTAKDCSVAVRDAIAAYP